MIEEMIKDEEIVVTGGAGFIGSNLSETLAVSNDVTIIDDFSTGRMENIETLLKKPNVTLMQESVTDLEALNVIFKNKTYVFHQGALPSVPRSIKDPLTSHNTNITGTLNVLLAARDRGVAKVVFAASSSAYGETPTLPKMETMKSSPLSPYAVTKICCEEYLKVFNDLYGLRTTSLRYFNVYGPKQDPASQYAAVIPKFITAVMKDVSPTIYGDGKQSRDFTFIRDVVQANIRAAVSEGCDGAVCNIATGKRITLEELAQKIIRALGKNIKARYEPPRPGDIKHSLADITRARELMGYEPEYTIDTGLAETIAFFKKGKK